MSFRFNRFSRFSCIAATFTLLAACLAGLSHAQTVDTVMDNGPSSNRVDLIFIGDGYTSSQIDTVYTDHVQDELDYLFSGAFRNPFPRYQNFFNAHKVNVVSNESGADQPPNNIFKDTALDASYWWGGSVERCLYLDTSKANTAVNSAISGTGIDIDARFGLVNDAKYGGCGGQWAVYAAANSVAADIGVHELGHSLGNLADEYFYSGTNYTGSEPGSVNLTRAPTTGKWDRWDGYNDPDTNIGPIGYFEGGGYNEFGLFRPSNNSEMRSLNRPFDAISRERFIQKFYQEVDPLDGWLPNSTTLDGTAQLWVDTIDPAVINVEWIVNGNSVGNLGETLDVSTLGLAAGSHTIQARAYDAILDHSFTGDSLDWWRLPNTSALQQSISWTVEVTSAGDFNDDGIYNCADIDALVWDVSGGTGNLDFDLTGDGVVDTNDIDAWLAEAGAVNLASGDSYLYGDANLDGNVDASDFNIWNGNKFFPISGWCSGDFNADGVVDASDFNVWNAHKFQAADANVTAVPEPSGLAGLCLALLSMTAFFRRRR